MKTLTAAFLFLTVAAAASAEQARVSANRANLRAEPKADSPVVSTLDRGTVVEVVARSGDWWQVRVVDATATGWVRSNFLAALAQPPTVDEPPAAEPGRTEPAPRGDTSRAPRSRADAGPRLKLEVDGAFGATTSTFDESRTFTEFAEEGVVRTSYEGKAGPGFEGGLQYRFFRHVGLAAAVSVINRDEEGAFDAELPHPLFLNRDREVTGALTGFKYKETGIHVGVVFTGTGGPLGYSLFAGPSWIKVETDVLDRLQYSHAYPYDTVTVTGTPARKVDDSPLGFHVGGGLDYRFGARFGLGAKVRFSQAKAKLIPVAGQTIELDAGGLQVGAGLRIFF